MAILYCWSGAAGSGSGADWTNAKTTLTAAFATEAAGDTIYVAHDHAESTAATINLTSSGNIFNTTKVVCVNRAGSVPPVSADRRTTAQVTTTGASHINFTGRTHYDGIIFNCGTGASGTMITIPNGTGESLRFDNCSLRSNTTGSFFCGITIGGSGFGATYVEFNNTTVSFAHTGQNITPYGVLKWRATPSALLGTIPTTLFNVTAAENATIECIGVDFSAAGSGKTLVASTQGSGSVFRFVDCNLNASVTRYTVPTQLGGMDIDFIRCGATGINYGVFSGRAHGTLENETTIVRTGGASDGTTPISWKIVTTSLSTFSMPFECPPIAIWNATTGSAVTATVEGIWGGGAVPNDDDVWLDVEYLGDASSPQGSFANDGRANLVIAAAAQTSSSATWGGSTTKFKMAVTFTPQQAGWIYCRVKCAKASSTFYIDPLCVLT